MHRSYFFSVTAMRTKRRSGRVTEGDSDGGDAGCGSVCLGGETHGGAVDGGTTGGGDHVDLRASGIRGDLVRERTRRLPMGWTKPTGKLPSWLSGMGLPSPRSRRAGLAGSEASTMQAETYDKKGSVPLSCQLLHGDTQFNSTKFCKKIGACLDSQIDLTTRS